MRINKIILGIAAAAGLTACGAEGNDPGLEYAPQMYHSIPYEPLSQMTESEVPTGLFESLYDYYTNTNPFVDSRKGGKKVINMMEPVEGTVARQNYKAVTGSLNAAPDQALLYYKDIKAEDLELAQAVENPLEDSKAVVAEGKRLYESYCQHCHGTDGKGKGKVSEAFMGIANLTGKSTKGKTDGHIFHIITHGQGNMWPHASQVNPEERWKIVKYVRVLQGN
ncbi:cytochrome c [Algivirga pacifica]|uniref:Cytochrome c domain-containing protein n=1 Tax=Algivirga pacifica TaxID=1162670 RepID=A0ABP9DBK2_9BACT